ncbi:MAG: NAD(P)H-binding protein [Cytophagaceae bacterium]|nr:NAD(P)H-binding protein [Cytophagaceae bacterium]
MDAPQKTALIVGATGLVGNYLLFKLLRDTRYDNVRSLVRRSMHLKHARLDERVVDFDNLPAEAFTGVADVFCCLGTTIRQAGSQDDFKKVDFQYPLVVAQRALAAGAKQFLLVTSLGADPRSRVFYSRVKGELEDAVAGLGYESFHSFRPSMLLGKRKEFRLGESVGKALMILLTPVFLIPGLRQYAGIQAAKVANAMLTIAKRDQAGRHIWLSDQLQEF